jgi:hypothetical protein
MASVSEGASVEASSPASGEAAAESREEAVASREEAMGCVETALPSTKEGSCGGASVEHTDGDGLRSHADRHKRRRGASYRGDNGRNVAWEGLRSKGGDGPSRRDGPSTNDDGRPSNGEGHRSKRSGHLKDGDRRQTRRSRRLTKRNGRWTR